MKISVIMIDGSFRENAFAAKYFSEQNFPQDSYEIIWVEFYKTAHKDVVANNAVNIITLNNERDVIYHSSKCFNEGIRQARGNVIVIPDADLIVPPDFLSKVWQIHQSYEKLVVYGYRYDEVEEGTLNTHDFDELGKKCKMINPSNYGGCLTVRKKWLLAINGYEEHDLFQTGNHANGFDMYTRFKNYGLAVQWEPRLILYHPWHFFTLQVTPEHKAQLTMIQWRKNILQYMAIHGIDPALNHTLDEATHKIFSRECEISKILQEK